MKVSFIITNKEFIEVLIDRYIVLLSNRAIILPLLLSLLGVDSWWSLSWPIAFARDMGEPMP